MGRSAVQAAWLSAGGAPRCAARPPARPSVPIAVPTAPSCCRLCTLAAVADWCCRRCWCVTATRSSPLPCPCPCPCPCPSPSRSWNSGWGDNGLFKIRRGTDECGIEEGALGGLRAAGHAAGAHKLAAAPRPRRPPADPAIANNGRRSCGRAPQAAAGRAALLCTASCAPPAGPWLQQHCGRRGLAYLAYRRPPCHPATRPAPRPVPPPMQTWSRALHKRALCERALCGAGSPPGGR